MTNIYHVYHSDIRTGRRIEADTREEAEAIGAIIFGVPSAEIIARYVITKARSK